VDTDKIIQRAGPLAIAGRYHNARPLEWDIKVDKKAVLGAGMGGDVRLGSCVKTGRKYAVKSFQKQGMTSRQRELATSEAEVYLQLDHPHIAQLERIYETPAALHLVMEPLTGGELFDHIVKRTSYSEDATAQAAGQMLTAVAYLHAHGFVHRDLKPENWLYESATSDFLKLIDFGFARAVADGERMSSACGTIQYTAPEVVAQSYTEKADVWSMGIVIYVMLCGALPWQATENRDIYRCVKEGSVYYSRSRFDPLSMGAKHFVRSLLVRDPRSRPSAAEALKHSWICERSRRHCAIEFDIQDAIIVQRMRKFAEAPSLQRACWTLLARSATPEAAAKEDWLRQRFLAVAAEGRGSIGLRDLKEALGGSANPFGTDEVRTLFEGLDVSGNGEISYSEFLAAASFEETASEPCSDAFRAFDSVEAARELLCGDDPAQRLQVQKPLEKAGRSLVIPANSTLEYVKDLCWVIAAAVFKLRLLDFGL
jgi:calcium-dependent protein kinase